MFNKVITGLLVIAIGFAIGFGYLYNIQKNINVDISIDNSRYERDLAFSDSIKNRLTKANKDLDSALNVYVKENAEIKAEKEKI